MKMQKQLPVFVYGTLRTGFGNYNRLLKGQTVVEHAAVTTGAMYSVNSGAFPALIKQFTLNTEAIKGELMYIHPEKYDVVLRSLDWLEGYNPRRPEHCMYVRESVMVFNESEGRTTEAWIYYWKGSIEGMKRVECGCWREYKEGPKEHLDEMYNDDYDHIGGGK